jgi:hypothetical protein
MGRSKQGDKLRLRVGNMPVLYEHVKNAHRIIMSFR